MDVLLVVLLTTAPDGMIVEAFGPCVGADNDHILQVGMGTLTTFHPTIILFVPIL